MLASDPVPTLNQKSADLGIPPDSNKPHPALMHVIGAAADKCRPIGGEESDQLRHFLRLARPTDGNASEHVHDPLASGLLADTIVLPPCGGSNPPAPAI